MVFFSSLRSRAPVLFVAAVLQAGCITGKAFEGARLDERVSVIHGVCRDDDVIRVRYRAVVTREFGEIVAQHERGAEIAVAPLKERPRRRVDKIEVVHIDPGDAAIKENCLPVTVRVEGLGHARDGTWVSEPGGASDDVLELPAGALHRDRTAAWVWPLVPITVALDVITTPPFFLAGVLYTASGD